MKKVKDKCTCGSPLYFIYDEEDDSSWIFENNAWINVVCQDCEKRGSVKIKILEVDI